MSSRIRALEALGCHKVMTARQLDRLHNVPPRVLTGLPRVTLTVSPVHMRNSLYVDATFVALDERDLNRRQCYLTHWAGTAEMQAALGVPLDRWRVLPTGWRQNRPDAEYDDPDRQGIIAAEFDSGTYTRTKIKEKCCCFAKTYSSTVWGVCSSVRRRHIADLVPRVVVAPWWISERRNG